MATTQATSIMKIDEEIKGDSKGGKYLIFKMADEDHGLEILKIQEIIGIMPLTRVPKVPDFVLSMVVLL